MKINKVLNTSFTGSLIFKNKPKIAKVLPGIENDKEFMENYTKDFTARYNSYNNLSLNTDRITDIDETGIMYKMPYDNIQVKFTFDTPLNTQDYTKMLAAYTAAKVSNPTMTVSI